MNKPGGGTDTKKRVTTISWIPFQEMVNMYRDLDKFIQAANENHFGFGDVRVTENAQFTEYPVGGFYDWHMDCDINMQHEPPVRKISMTLLLNDPSEFEGGHLELGAPGKFGELKQGHAIAFASFINHRVQPVTRGVRQSLVVWFGGKPFR
jgi:PKHD-type hydroxylase